MLRASPSKRYSGHCKAADEEGDPGTPGKGIGSKKCGQRASGTAGES